jgi:hypothetical protein
MKTDFLKYILVLTFAAVSAVMASAQENTESVGYDYVDSLVHRTVPAVDSVLFGADVFSVMPQKNSGGGAGVTIRQSQMIEESMKAHVEANKSRSLTGYRIRIFFDNSQSARVNSSRALDTFMLSFRGIPAYRSYANPYFKVTVGDYRTKAEAMAALPKIKNLFPSAFIVKEKINYPQIGTRLMDTVVDTIKVYRPKTETLQ